MKTLILIILMMTPLMTSASTGHDQGSGGDGLWLDGKLYSLDLVEAGVEQNPYFNPAVKIDSVIAKRMAQKFDGQEMPVALLTAKLSEVYAVDKLFGLFLLQGIESYQWRLVNSALIDINDDYSPLKYVQQDLVQLASRAMNSIMIDRSLWDKLDEKNRVALILHEVIYAMYPLEGKAYYGQSQSSPRARELNGYLFTSDLSRNGQEGLHKVGSEYTMMESGDRCPYNLVEKYDNSDTLVSCPDFYLTSMVAYTWRKNTLPTKQQVEEYAQNACARALSENNHKLHAEISWGLSYTTSFDRFQDGAGLTKGYLNIAYVPSLADRYQGVTFDYSDQATCTKAATKAIYDFVDWIKTHYR